ncbi:MAG TPA: PASTA domain-containing protein [Polyangiaceae bacterium]|nr:PASTA domain-containing protein [Polyangiaceae bacterium]
MHGSSVFLVAFLTAAATATGAVYVIERYNILPHKVPTPEAVVPALQGVTEADARANAQAAHVSLLVASREPSAEAKPGTVLRQSIPGGQRVPIDHPISIVLADELPKVPNVSGVTVGEATQRVEAHGYHLQVGATIAHATVAQGLVIEQTPKADAPQAKGATVIVQVSAGPGDIDVPKVVGMSVEKAKTNLEKLGAKPQVRWVAMAETPTYVVLAQKPPPGQKIKPGGEVVLTACR